jgi:hypothetical protein
VTYLGTWVYEKHPKTGKLVRVRKIRVNYSEWSKKMEWKQYTKTGSVEATPWTPDYDMSKVRSKETPVKGDMIARNPKDRDDQWLIKADFFEQNYQEL